VRCCGGLTLPIYFFRFVFSFGVFYPNIGRTTLAKHAIECERVKQMILTKGNDAFENSESSTQFLM